MKIDEHTKVIGRFHTQASPRGLNIYNPFFQATGMNAVYLLFYNQDPKILIDGMRNLHLAGAITAGFESDSRLPTLLDEIDETATYVGKIGFITNNNGRLKGYNQSGEGLLRSIEKSQSLAGKKMAIVGAGNVVKSLLFTLSKRKVKLPIVTIYNRTPENAEKLVKDFSFVKRFSSLDQIAHATGDILVNISHIGGKEADTLFSEAIVGRFQTIADVTFEKEDTNLISLAKKLGKKYSTGWDMFAYQGQVILETLLDVKVDFNVLKKYVAQGLSKTVK